VLARRDRDRESRGEREGRGDRDGGGGDRPRREFDEAPAQ
jgi:hypothetical protein